MKTATENGYATRSLTDLFKNPSDLLGIVSNPGKYGLDFYKSLSNRDKQYIAFAGGVGLIIYGFYLRRTDK